MWYELLAPTRPLPPRGVVLPLSCGQDAQWPEKGESSDAMLYAGVSLVWTQSISTLRTPTLGRAGLRGSLGQVEASALSLPTAVPTSAHGNY